MITAIASMLIGLIVGLAFGAIFGPGPKKTVVEGNLRIDLTDPEDLPYIFLELDSSIQEVLEKEYVTLKVIPRK